LTASQHEWTSTTSPSQGAEWLRSAGSIAVLTHAKPDGDAAGSSLALCRSLRQGGIDAVSWFVGPNPPWLAELAGPTPYRTFPPGSQPAPSQGDDHSDIDDQRAAVIVDTGAWSQLAEFRTWLESRRERTMVIDHHLHGDPDITSNRLLDIAAASCTEIVAPLCAQLLNLDSTAKLPTEIASPIYLGLATDTGWFRHSNVRPATLRIAADLLDAGVDHAALYTLVEQQDTAARWRLLGRALSTLELARHGSVAVVSLSLEDFRLSKASPNDTGGFADKLLTIGQVQVAAVLTESAPENPDAEPITKISFRSKPGRNPVDVNELARKLGGGGHARAAGAKINQPLANARELVLKALS